MCNSCNRSDNGCGCNCCRQANYGCGCNSCRQANRDRNCGCGCSRNTCGGYSCCNAISNALSNLFSTSSWGNCGCNSCGNFRNGCGCNSCGDFRSGYGCNSCDRRNSCGCDFSAYTDCGVYDEYYIQQYALSSNRSCGCGCN